MYVCTYYSALKKEILPYAITRKNLEDIMLCESSHLQRTNAVRFHLYEDLK